MGTLALLAAISEKQEACGPPGAQRWLCDVVYDATGSRTSAEAAHHLAPLVAALLVVLVAWLVAKIITRVIARFVRRIERDQRSTDVPTERRLQRAVTIGHGLRSLAHIVVWTVAGIAVLTAFGVNLAAVITSAGLLGVALGFGAQNVTRDLLAGAFMIFEDQFGVGDVVDVGVASGTVEQVSLRVTRLRDVEGVAWHVPNGEIRRVGNRSQQWARAILDVPISPDADIEAARSLIETTARTMATEETWRTRVLERPEVWGVESFGGDRVVLRLAVKTLPAEQWSVARELRARLKVALDAAGVAAPAFPIAPPAAAPPV